MQKIQNKIICYNKNREQTFPLTSNYISYYFDPVFRLFLSLLIRIILPYLRGLYSLELGLLLTVKLFKASYAYEHLQQTYLYDGSCSISTLANPLGFASPKRSARLSKAS